MRVLESARARLRRTVMALPPPPRGPVRAGPHTVKLLLRAVCDVARWPKRTLPARLKGLGLAVLERFSEWLLVRVAVPLGRRRTQARLAQGAPASLWGVTPILTLPLKARADRLLGIRSKTLVWTNYYVTNDFDWNLKKIGEWVNRRTPTLYVIFTKIVFAWSLLRFDIFHYFADRGILLPSGDFGMNAHELKILQLAGKRLYVFTYGADVRTRAATLALGDWNFCRDCDHVGLYCICNDDIGQRNILSIDRRATAMVSLGDMLAYVPTAYHIAYWPIDCDRIVATTARQSGGALKIAHAPNHTHFKGTKYLENSIERLRARGFEIELIRISGVSNDEVLRLFSDGDIVLDQLIGGAYGYTALEALAVGRPVITYIRHRGLLEAPDECPFINANPNTIDRALEWCALNRSRLSAIGEQGRIYIERHHSIPAVAARLARLYMETADLPSSVFSQMYDFTLKEANRKASIAKRSDWQHPWVPRAPSDQHRNEIFDGGGISGRRDEAF